jgi:rubrerythrin
MPEDAAERAKRLFLIFKNAIEREKSTQAIYKEAAELCDNESLKKVLEGFYRDEVRHEEGLLEYYSKLREQYNLET